MIKNVRFLGGPYDGLAQGWNVDDGLPDEVRISPKLGYTRGGVKMEITSPSACGVLRDGEVAKDEVVYVQREPGVYYLRGRNALAEA